MFVNSESGWHIMESLITYNDIECLYVVVKFNEKKIMFQSNKTRLITLLFASF